MGLAKNKQVFRLIRAQGATEYLVVLSVVLIIGLVSVSLLSGSLSGVSDAKNSESAIYWQSAQPIAISQSDAGSGGITLRLRNNGADQLYLTGLVADGAASAVSPPLSLGPGEEYTFQNISGLRSQYTGGGAFGSLTFGGFGFQYTLGQYGVSHSQSGGKPLVVQCSSECSGSADNQTGCGIGCGYGFACCQIVENNYGCVMSPGFCSGLDTCPAGQYNCAAGTMGCIPIGSVCNNCGGACGAGRVCCVCDGQCTDAGACACEHCQTIQCVGGNCICVAYN